MSGKPSLLYFDLTGRGEIIRLLYRYAGVEFEDRRISFPEFPALKTNAEECPLGFLPVLTTPCGRKISQTTAIIRYVANELNLFGKNNLEKALIDSTIVSNKELGDICVEILFKLKDEAKIEARREDLRKQIKIFFTYFERMISETGGPFLNGSEITVGDIYFYNTIEFLSGTLPKDNVLADYPALKVICEKVGEKFKK